MGENKEAMEKNQEALAIEDPPPGVEPPSEEEQLEFLKEHGGFNDCDD